MNISKQIDNKLNLEKKKVKPTDKNLSVDITSVMNFDLIKKFNNAKKLTIL